MPKFDANALIGKAQQAQDDRLETALGNYLAAGVNLAERTDLPTMAKVNCLEGLGDAAQQATVLSFAPGGVSGLLQGRPRLALGGGSSSPEGSVTTPRSNEENEALDLLKAITDHMGLSPAEAAEMAGSFLRPLMVNEEGEDVDDQERKVRLKVMGKVASGRLPVNKRSGNLGLEEDLDTEKTSRGELQRQLRDIGSAAGASNPTDVGEVRNKIRELVQGGTTPLLEQLQTDLNADGPAELPKKVRELKRERDEAVQDHRRLKDAHDKAEAVIEDIKHPEHLRETRGLGRSGDRVLRVDKLSEDSQKALGLKS